ncbi:MAG: hypothetical protein Q8Q92_04085 [bacterium]|nr:hypothetical protein [bacterium]
MNDSPDKKEWFLQKKLFSIFGVEISLWVIIGFLFLTGPIAWKATVATISSNSNFFSSASKKALNGDIGGATSVLFEPESENNNPGDCSDLEDKWELDSNTKFEGNRIKLKAGESAGTIFLKDDPKSLLNFRIKFKSTMKTGINTNISFENGNDSVKYAIGDGDFRTIRYYRSDNNGPTYILDSETRLSPEIDNQYSIEFTMGIVKLAQGNKMVGSLIYGKDGINPADLEEIVIKNPERISLTLGFGLEGKKELEEDLDDIFIELESCEISE